jgi:PPOX class probable F420-dependent enzyme
VTAGARSAVAMSEGEIWSFLAESSKLQLGTVHPDGGPHLATMFYAMEDGRIAFWTYARSQKVRNLERNPRLSCLVESGWDYAELRGVLIRGTAEIFRTESDVRRIGMSVARAVRGEEIDETRRRELEGQAAKRVAVLVHPSSVASWDHRRLARRAV